MPYAFAHFITDGEGCQPALDLYRSTFRPGLLDKPVAVICVSALAAETEQEAWHLFRSRERARIDRRSGKFGPLLPPDEAQRPYDSAEQIELRLLRERAIVGSARQVRDKLLALAARHQVDELVLVTWAWDPAAQKRSYELLAGAFELA
jgi:alkanesulfonate monooxygenase SsuD/methylene tetrahydromethanopterin reductase-like flavin-dependent oxidoreductase (luciferase family)